MTTRLSQIQEAALSELNKVYGKREDEIFEMGATWADKNPDVATIGDMEMLIAPYMKAISDLDSRLKDALARIKELKGET